MDPLRRTVRAQGGVTWGELDRETKLLGMAVAGGIVSDTGIAGLTLSGGLGWHRRKHGMTIDNLASADVVTADGRLLVASETENPDLFWAIRGGGGNFGVVTSFEYHMNRVGPEVAFALVFYPIEELVRVVAGWREFVAGAPDEITADLVVWTLPPAPAFPEELHGRPFVGVAAMYAGAADHGMRMLRPLRVLTIPLLDLTGTMPYATVQTMFDAFHPAGTERRYWKSLYLRGIPGDAIREIEQRMARAPSPRTLLSIRHLGGEIARVPADATAFGDRAAPFLLSIDSTWVDSRDDEENIAWARSFWFAMRRWSNGQVYFNFPGLLEENDLLVSASYGANFERLRILKTKYDPTNFFRMNQNIRPI